MPQAGGRRKKWPLARFSALGDRFSEELGAKIIILWGPGEIDEARQVRDGMKNDAVLIPETSLKQLGAILQKCAMIVSNDSGPMHISAAVGTPTVGIFGPTDPAKQGPYGCKNEVAINGKLDCLGCDKTSCEGDECMQELEVDEVWKTALNCLKKNNLI